MKLTQADREMSVLLSLSLSIPASGASFHDRFWEGREEKCKVAERSHRLVLSRLSVGGCACRGGEVDSASAHALSALLFSRRRRSTRRVGAGN